MSKILVVDDEKLIVKGIHCKSQLLRSNHKCLLERKLCKVEN